MRKAGGIFLLIIATVLNLTACGRIPATKSNEPISASSITSGSAIQISDPAADALQAYYDILSQEEYRNEENEDTIMETHFAISDLNTDGIPELLICGSSNILYLGEYYTYENGAVTKIEGPGEEEGYPQYGSLYTLPYRNTYVFFRGGPAWEEEEDGNGYMPYILVEYSLNPEDHQIHMVSYADWSICYYGSKAGTTECEINGKECSVEEIINQYSLKIEKTESGWDRYYFPDGEENYIEFLPNTDTNRKAIVAGTDSNEKTIGTDLDADRKATNTDSDSDQTETE
ncbi:MAG: hypothetical protein K2J67_09105 [Lachnospiraceae bacterium]|nr:hypothetical protein [Lachnospiraceae bacterium]